MYSRASKRGCKLKLFNRIRTIEFQSSFCFFNVNNYGNILEQLKKSFGSTRDNYIHYRVKLSLVLLI